MHMYGEPGHAAPGLQRGSLRRATRELAVGALLRLASRSTASAGISGRKGCPFTGLWAAWLPDPDAGSVGTGHHVVGSPSSGKRDQPGGPE